VPLPLGVVAEEAGGEPAPGTGLASEEPQEAGKSSLERRSDPLTDLPPGSAVQLLSFSFFQNELPLLRSKGLVHTPAGRGACMPLLGVPTRVAPGDGRKASEIRPKPAAGERGSRSRRLPKRPPAPQI
jgi:hypothetical protein